MRTFCKKIHSNDIEFAFKFLDNNLLRIADELSTSARVFISGLQHFYPKQKQINFNAIDVSKAKPTHPRTLNRYL